MRDVPPEHPADPEPCPDCGYPIDACECATLFGDEEYIDPDLASRDETPDESDDEPWYADYPSERVRAAPVTETTAGVDVSRHDLDAVDMPPMYGIHQYYPPEDDVEGESVYVHGEYAALQVAATLVELASDGFDPAPLDDDPREDSDAK